jgi:hypothetical protein
MPDVVPFAAFLAQRLPAARVVCVGTALDGPGTPAPPGLMTCPNAASLPAYLPILEPGEPRSATAGPRASSRLDAWEQTVVVAAGPDEHGGWDDPASLAALARLTILATPSGRREEAAAALSRRGLIPVFAGHSRDGESFATRRGTGVLVFESRAHSLSHPGLATPDGFTVVAFILTYNEEDVIGATLEDLSSQGVSAYVIDNWSTDATWEIARQMLGRPVVGLERYPPEGPPDYYDLRGLLDRVEALTRTVAADWFTKHDADEIRQSPWPGVTMRDALFRVQAAGYNCADFTVLNFPPTDDSFVPGTRFADHFRHFEFGSNRPYFRQLKAWQNRGRPIEYARTGGHEVRYPDRRVFPYKFLLRHYPIRSQRHGERKVFLERQARFLPEARARGWHRQYDGLQPGHRFVRAPESLMPFDEETFAQDYLIERLSGVGLPRQARRTGPRR